MHPQNRSVTWGVDFWAGVGVFLRFEIILAIFGHFESNAWYLHLARRRNPCVRLRKTGQVWLSNVMGIRRNEAPNTPPADEGSPLAPGVSAHRRENDKRRRRGQIGFRFLLAAVFLVVAVVIPIVWPSVTYIQTLPAAAAVVGAIIAIQKADASADAAARAEAAQETAERASRAAHYALAFQARPNVSVLWTSRQEDHPTWGLLLLADREATDIEGKWHYADGRPPLNVTFPEVMPDPSGSLSVTSPALVIRLGIPTTVKVAEIHKHIVKGSLEFSDGAGLARWRSVWRYMPPDPSDPFASHSQAPNSTHELTLVKLLEIPDDL